MTSFIPSQHFKDFTDFIIKRCIDNDQFYFTIFPLFIDVLLPFSISNDCKESIKDLALEQITDFKDFKKYFTSLFFYYKLLEERYTLQLEILRLIKSLASSAFNEVDARKSEGAAVTADIPPQQPRVEAIQTVFEHYTLLNELDSKILKAKTDFEHIHYWEFSEFHSFILGSAPTANAPNADATANAPNADNANANATADATADATANANATGSVETKQSEPAGESDAEEPLEVKVDSNTLGKPRPLNIELVAGFIPKCTQNLKKEKFVIDLDSLFDDSPDVLFQKFVLLMCNNYTANPDFINAKFWVLSQLYSRL